MKEKTVNNFEELHQSLVEYREDKRWIFRGHSNKKWTLLPKIGRNPFSGVDEKMVFESWKRAAIEYVDKIPNNDWDWLAIAQHHGIATRLLDWTTNPLNAFYFAVNEEISDQAVVFAAKFKYRISENPSSTFKFKDIAIFRPRRVVPRITRQGGLFTIHPNPTESINEKSKNVCDMHRIVIAKDYRNKLLSELSFYGINAVTLFPDLDGLSKFINWAIETKEYWQSHYTDDEAFG